jgi:hypothetical protein
MKCQQHRRAGRLWFRLLGYVSDAIPQSRYAPTNSVEAAALTLSSTQPHDWRHISFNGVIPDAEGGLVVFVSVANEHPHICGQNSRRRGLARVYRMVLITDRHWSVYQMRQLRRPNAKSL